MKNKTVFLLAFFIGFFSCKKDYPIDTNTLIDAPFVQHFYADGNLFDHLNNIELGFEFSGITFGSASSIGSENGKKYITSVVSNEASFARGVFSHETVGNYIFTMNNMISVKLVSDRPAEEASRKFTRDELLEMLEVGKKYELGNAPQQIEIDFRKSSVDTLPEFSFMGYIGESAGVDNVNSSVEIISMEDYEEEEVKNPVKGLKVKTKINADVRFVQWSIISLLDVEAVFLFEYE